MPLYSNIVKDIKSNYKIFIETGTYMGNGVQTAYNLGFKNIYSIEFSDYYYNYCIQRFKDYHNIHLYKGGSATLLNEILQNITEPSVIFLDAHYCADGVTGLDNVWIPIKEELEAIKNNKIKEHIIIIDDMMAMDNTHFDAKTGKWAGAPGIDKVINLLIDINPNYEIIPLIKEDQLIAIPKNNTNINYKTQILDLLFEKRLNEKRKVAKELYGLVLKKNIPCNNINFDINNIEELELIKMNLSIKLSKFIDTTLPILD
jgi:hypothetical protein